MALPDDSEVITALLILLKEWLGLSRTGISAQTHDITGTTREPIVPPYI